MYVRGFSRVWLFGPPWTAAYQAPLSMRFSRKNTGVGFHALLQGIFLTQGSNLGLCIAGWFFTIWVTKKAQQIVHIEKKSIKKKGLIFVRLSDESPLALMVCDFLCSWTDVFSPNDFPKLNKFCYYHSVWTPRFCGWTCGAWWLVFTPGWVCRPLPEETGMDLLGSPTEDTSCKFPCVQKWTHDLGSAQDCNCRNVRGHASWMECHKRGLFTSKACREKQLWWWPRDVCGVSVWCFCVFLNWWLSLFVTPVPYVLNAGSEPSTEGLNEMIYVKCPGECQA